MKNGKESKNNKAYIPVIITILVVITLVILFFVNSKTKDNIDSNIYNDEVNLDSDIQNESQNIEIDIKKELFEDYYAKAEELMKNMSIEEKIGQMCLARCPETGQIEEINSYKPGGYVLFGRDFQNETKESVISKINSYQEASNIKMLIAVDEEGGTVTRVSRYSAFRSEKFKSPQELYNEGGLDLIKSDAKEKIDLLKSLNINLNLAPVSDVSTNPQDFIYKRALGQDADKTSEYVKEYTNVYNENKFGMCLKHFPGYGNNADTHTDFVRDDRQEEQFKNSDFLPFIAGIENNAQSILVAHNVVAFKDSENPASLSKVWHDFLRNDLDFSGVIITDDLAMGAIANIYSVEESAIKAVNAGNDMLITSDLKACVDAIKKGVDEKTVNEEDINNAVKRILAWKCYLGII